MQIRWLRTALRNLDSEAEYSAKDNPSAAARTVESIIEAVLQLRSYPAMGRPGRVLGTRELVISGTPYIIPYRVRRETVEILRVFHDALRWPATFDR